MVKMVMMLVEIVQILVEFSEMVLIMMEVKIMWMVIEVAEMVIILMLEVEVVGRDGRTVRPEHKFGLNFRCSDV